MPTNLSTVKTAFGAASATLRQLKKGDGIVHPNDTLPNYPGAATDVKLTYFQSAARKFPAFTSVASTTFGTYNGSTFPYTIVVNVTDTESSSVGLYASNQVTFTGTVAPSTTPSTGAFVLTGYYSRTSNITSQTGTAAAPALPTFSSVTSTTIGTYNGTAFPYTIVVSVGNTTGSSAGSYASNTVTFTGTVAQSTTPTTGAFRITGANGGYIDVTSKSGTAGSPALPSFGSVTGTTIDSDYNGSTFGYTITVSVANTSGTNSGTLSGSTISFTGRVNPSTTPTTAGFRITGANGGYIDVPSKSGSAGSPALPTAGNVTGTTINSDYNGSTFGYSITVSVSNTTSTNSGTYSNNAITFTGRVNPSTAPTTGGFRITGANGGYIDVASKSGSSSPALPSFGSVTGTTINSDYNGSTFGYTITVSVANTSGSNSGQHLGNSITFTGRVNPSTTPTTGGFRITGANGGYVDVGSQSGTAGSPALPSFGGVSGTTINNDYNGSTFGYTITVSVANTSGTNSGNHSGNSITFSGRVGPNTTPTTGEFRITGANGGYVDVGSQSGTAGSGAAPAATTPSITANNGSSYGSYSASVFPINSWTLSTANTTSISLNTYTGFSGAPSVSLSGSTIYVTGNVTASTTPSVTFNLYNAAGGYTTASTTSYQTGTATGAGLTNYYHHTGYFFAYSSSSYTPAFYPAEGSSGSFQDAYTTYTGSWIAIEVVDTESMQNAQNRFNSFRSTLNHVQFTVSTYDQTTNTSAYGVFAGQYLEYQRTTSLVSVNPNALPNIGHLAVGQSFPSPSSGASTYIVETHY